MILMIIFGILLIFLVVATVNNFLKKRKLREEWLHKSSIFKSSYCIHKEVNKIRNISTFSLDKVLNYLNRIPDIKVHVSTVNGVMVDFIIEMIEPVMRTNLIKKGIPNTTYALDRIELTEYYLRCLQKPVTFDYMLFVSSQCYSSVKHEYATYQFIALSELHALQLKTQMVDENDFRYWLKSSFIY